MILQIKPVIGGFHLTCAAGETAASGRGAAGSAHQTAGEEFRILPKKLTGSAKLIRSGGKTVCKTEILREGDRILYLAKQNGTEYAQAELTCRPCSGPVSMIRPPQGVHLDIRTPYGSWEADRQNDQSVLFSRASTVIGKISPFFSIRPQIFACSGEYPASLWAVLYVFAAYMMHEGEVDII